ncbi:MAG: peptide synthase, partial [Nannocystaceae bacterium]
ILGDDGEIWHRMGDVGYLDAHGNLWFCGRKAHRVRTDTRTMFSIPTEGIFNTHPEVFRSALIGLPCDVPGALRPALCVELEATAPSNKHREICAQLREMAHADPRTAEIHDILLHPSFPVDVRHNAKIDRPALARWAARIVG